MSRREWRCRNPTCPERGGAVLGRLVDEGSGLVLAAGVTEWAVYVDSGRISVTCPVCGNRREFRGRFVRSP